MGGNPSGKLWGRWSISIVQTEPKVEVGVAVVVVDVGTGTMTGGRDELLVEVGVFAADDVVVEVARGFVVVVAVEITRDFVVVAALDVARESAGVVAVEDLVAEDMIVLVVLCLLVQSEVADVAFDETPDEVVVCGKTVHGQVSQNAPQLPCFPVASSVALQPEVLQSNGILGQSRGVPGSWLHGQPWRKPLQMPPV